MSESATPTLSAANSVVSTVLSILKRLTAALQLLRLADEALPTLVASGATTQENADLISAQLPALRKDIDDQVNAAKVMMGSIQDRVESVAQFLMLHRKALRLDQSENLDHWLAQVRG